MPVTVHHLTERGGKACGTPAQVAGVAFEERDPVWQPKAYPGRRAQMGWWPETASGRRVGFSSLARGRIALLLDFAPDIRTFSSWPMRLVWPHADGSERTMVPDFFARRCDGAGLLVACPPADGSSRKWDTHQAVLGQVCVQADWHLATPQVPDSPAMAVLAMLGEYRTVPAPRPDLEKQLLEAFARPRPLEEGVASVGDPIALLPWAYHLMWRQLLCLDFASPLHLGALVWTDAS
ncbi:TnsA-like heteromeric transposase endonuclease subunit [Streptomyces sp. NPDC088554]|uniref:TnsA-like heteromeric transposase endonuclease subunit n=1 Tax=Streptomyces sp. NPDC088554 TaxID=3365865 RepID=UPI003805B01B